MVEIGFLILFIVLVLVADFAQGMREVIALEHSRCFFCGEVLANNDHATRRAAECEVMNTDPNETIESIVSRPAMRAVDVCPACGGDGFEKDYPVQGVCQYCNGTGKCLLNRKVINEKIR